MNIQLSEHFTYRKLFRFTLPSIIMMIFTSIYGVIDGLVVSNFAGKTAFTAVNFAYPMIMILGAVGFMIGNGGSAIIAKTQGEGKPQKAQQQFSFLIYTAIVIGIAMGLGGQLVLRPMIVALGARGEMLEMAVIYGRISLIAIPAFVLQYSFQTFFITAEKPNLGLTVTVAAGITNIVLDLLFVGGFHMGIAGAALGTALSQCVGGILPLIYFAGKNSSTLRLVKTGFDGYTLRAAFLNGSSELMSNISMSIVNMLYNTQLLRYAGNDGVAAYGVLMYVCMVFLAIYIGYAMGTAPIVSYHYGAGNTDELKNLRKKSLRIISVTSLAMLLAGELLARPLSQIYMGYDADLFAMTVRGFYIFSFSFLFSGLAIWSSSFFTALNNGPVSAFLSFMRTLVFEVVLVLVLPVFFGLDGIWFSIVLAEFLAVVVSMLFLAGLRKRYHY